MAALFGNLRAYMAYMALGIKEALAYKANMVSSFSFKIITVIVMILIWTAIYLNSKATAIAGFTLQSMYAYFLLYGAFAVITNSEIANAMQSDVQSGKVSASMIKPTNYVLQLFFTSTGSMIVWSLVVSIPLILIISLFVHLTLNAMTLLLLVVEVILGFAIYNIIEFFVGTTAVYLTYIWGVLSVTGEMVYLLAGSIMPLVLFPMHIRSIIFALPFQLIGYTESVTVLGIATPSYIINTIIVGVLWIIALLILATLWWGKVLRKLTVAGG